MFQLNLYHCKGFNESSYLEKSEAERQEDAELYQELKRRKSELEEKLLKKLEELRQICIKEAVRFENRFFFLYYEMGKRNTTSQEFLYIS